MSNSARAKLRRQRRSKLSKHQRTVKSHQCFTESQGRNRGVLREKQNANLADFMKKFSGKEE